MKNIENEKFVKDLSNHNVRGTYLNYIFYKDIQSLVPHNGCLIIPPKDYIQTLIDGLQNFVNYFPDDFIEEHNNNRKEEIKHDIDSTLENNINNIRIYKGYIYLMQDASKMIKIGLSINPQNRLDEIKTMNPTVKIIHTIFTNDMYNTEKLFHNMFSNKRTRGEWFNLNDDDIKYMLSGNYTKEIMDSIGGTNG